MISQKNGSKKILYGTLPPTDQDGDLSRRSYPQPHHKTMSLVEDTSIFTQVLRIKDLSKCHLSSVITLWPRP